MGNKNNASIERPCSFKHRNQFVFLDLTLIWNPKIVEFQICLGLQIFMSQNIGSQKIYYTNTFWCLKNKQEST